MLDLPRQWMVSMMDRGRLSSRAGTEAPRQLQSTCPELSDCRTQQGYSQDCRVRPAGVTVPQQGACLAEQPVRSSMSMPGKTTECLSRAA